MLLLLLLLLRRLGGGVGAGAEAQRVRRMARLALRRRGALPGRRGRGRARTGGRAPVGHRERFVRARLAVRGCGGGGGGGGAVEWWRAALSCSERLGCAERPCLAGPASAPGPAVGFSAGAGARLLHAAARGLGLPCEMFNSGSHGGAPRPSGLPRWPATHLRICPACTAEMPPRRPTDGRDEYTPRLASGDAPWLPRCTPCICTPLATRRMALCARDGIPRLAVKMNRVCSSPAARNGGDANDGPEVKGGR